MSYYEKYVVNASIHIEVPLTTEEYSYAKQMNPKEISAKTQQLLDNLMIREFCDGRQECVVNVSAKGILEY